jgi:hypothetical protein
MDALSGVEDFFEGSLHAGQVATSRPASRAAGINFVDKLSEVAFGESALSRPVTRDAVQDMLDRRSKGAIQAPNGKTVNEFMAELQQLQKQQQEEFDLIAEGKEMSGKSPTRASSVSTAETMHEQYFDGAQLAQDDDGILIDTLQRSRDASPFPRASVHDEEVMSMSSKEDVLPFLADRWTMKQKFTQLGICALWILIVQCLDSGYVESRGAIAATTHSDPVVLQAGQFAFLAGQGGGLLGGAALSPYGRYRIQPISVVLALALSLIVGFMHQIYPILALRGALGFLAGLFELSVCGMVLDLSAGRRERLLLIGFVATPVLIGQAAGPWITELILQITTWHWLYWMTTISAAVYLLASGAFVQETEPVSVFRKLVNRLRVQHRDVWTPEPEAVPGVVRLLKIYSVRPLHLLFRHVLVALCTVFAFVVTGSVAAIFATFSSQLVTRNALATWQATLLLSTCVFVGSSGALAYMTLVAARSDQVTDGVRKRFLLMDEKGIIDPVRPSFDAEILLRAGVCGLLASGISLYMLALTSALTHWILPAMSLVVLTGGSTASLISVIQYVSESYYPSAKACMGDLHLLPDHQGRPGSVSSGRAGRTQISQRELSDLDNTLMSAADSDGTRWSSSWALSALAIVMCASFLGAAMMTLLAPFATLSIGFSIFAAIVSSVELGIGGLCLLILVCSGKRMRHKSFSRIQQTEQKNRWTAKHRRDLSTAASAQTSSGTIRSPPLGDDNEGRNLNAASRPLHRRLSHSDWLRWIGTQSSGHPEKGFAAVKKRLMMLFSPLTRSSDGNTSAKRGQGKPIRQLSISQPFNAEHLATGASLASPATLRNPISPRPIQQSPFVGEHSHPRTMALEEQLSKEVVEDLAHWTVGRPTLRRIGRKDLENAMNLKAARANPAVEQQEKLDRVLLSPPPKALLPQAQQHTGIAQPFLSDISKKPLRVVYERQKTPPTEIVYRKPEPITVPARNAANIGHRSGEMTIKPIASTSRRTLTPNKEGKGKAAASTQFRSLPVQRQSRQRQAAHGGGDIPVAL